MSKEIRSTSNEAVGAIAISGILIIALLLLYLLFLLHWVTGMIGIGLMCVGLGCLIAEG